MANVVRPVSSTDLLFATNHVIEPDLRARRSVLTIHDLSVYEHPEWHPAERVSWFSRYGIPAIASADRIVTVSKTVAEAVMDRFAVSRSRVVPIPLGVDRDRFSPRSSQAALERFRIDRPFVLSVGTLEPRKNFGALLDAWISLPEAVRNAHLLVLAGGDGWNNADARARCSSTKGVRWLGYIDHEAMVALMSGCSAFIYPSLYEGFGLPPLEAMACGAPVIVLDHPPMPEVSGPGALVVPASGGAEALSSALSSLLNDSEISAALRRRGLAHVSRYSWESTADATAKILTETG